MKIKCAKTVISLFTALALMCSLFCLPVFAASDIKVLVNGKQLEFDVMPMMVGDRVFVPMRAIFEALGATIEWSDEDQTVTAVCGDTSVFLQVGNDLAKVDTTLVTLDAEPFVEQERTMVPLRFVGEALGAEVNWDEKRSTVTISQSTVKSFKIPLSAVAVIDKDDPGKNLYEERSGSWTDNIGTGTVEGKEYDRRMLYKFDVSELIGQDLAYAKLVIKERAYKYGAKLSFYRVNDDWDMETITYDTAPAYDPEGLIATKTCPGAESEATVKEFDILAYIASLTDGNANMMVIAESSDRVNPSGIFGINSSAPPYIEAETAPEEVPETPSDEDVTSGRMTKVEIADSLRLGMMGSSIRSAVKNGANSGSDLNTLGVNPETGLTGEMYYQAKLPETEGEVLSGAYLALSLRAVTPGVLHLYAVQDGAFDETVQPSAEEEPIYSSRELGVGTQYEKLECDITEYVQGLIDQQKDTMCVKAVFEPLEERPLFPGLYIYSVGSANAPYFEFETEPETGTETEPAAETEIESETGDETELEAEPETEVE